MPTHTFNDRKPERDLLVEGEYLLTVKEWESKIAKKSGNEMIELKVKTDGAAAFYDRLVFTEEAEWRIDSFLKAIGKAPAVGASVNFDDDLLKEVRAWAKVGVEEYTDDRNQKRKKNVVLEWISGKAIPPLPMPADEFN